MLSRPLDVFLTCNFFTEFYNLNKMSEQKRVYPTSCEICAEDLGEQFVSTLDLDDVCTHWHWEVRNSAPMSSDGYFSSISRSPAPYDDDDSSYEFDLLR